MKKQSCITRAAKRPPRHTKKRGAPSSAALYRIDREPWASVGRGPLRRKTPPPRGLSDGPATSNGQVRFVKALNQKFKKTFPILGVHYRAYCCWRCQDGYVVRRWKANCTPPVNDPLTVAKPIGMSPHELNRWFQTHHHMAWSTFLKTPSDKLRKASAAAKTTRATTSRAGASGSQKNAASSPAKKSTSRPGGTAPSRPVKKTTPQPPAKKSRPLLAKERTTRNKEAKAVRSVNYKAIERDLDETLELLKKHIN